MTYCKLMIDYKIMIDYILMTDYKLMIDYKMLIDLQMHPTVTIYRLHHLKAPRPPPHVMALLAQPLKSILGKQHHK